MSVVFGEAHAGVASECLGNRGAGDAEGEGDRANGGSVGHGAEKRGESRRRLVGGVELANG